MGKLVVIGLDCAAPSLVFDRYADAMPFVSSLRERGTWGPLLSCRPPITVPAWTCMVSGHDPGELGLYGFRQRRIDDYAFRLATADDLRVKRVWDWLGEQGFVVAPLFVPLSFPPTPVRGQMVSGCLWPGPGHPWCFPRTLERELEARFGAYLADIEDFRGGDLHQVFGDLETMTAQHFAIARHIWRERAPDFLMMVEIGVDRLHHACWQHIDPTHPSFQDGNPWDERARQYYAQIDDEMRRWLAEEDDVNVMVVSDHGAQSMTRGFCINQWLAERGDLVFRQSPEGVTRFEDCDVDWRRTKAWAAGGYYARVFLNVRGRDRHGVIPPEQAPSVAAELADAIRDIRDPAGERIGVEIDTPKDAYRSVQGFAPDLMVYFDQLKTRAIGSVGHPGCFIRDNDTGHDGCNHSWQGIFVCAGPDVSSLGMVQGAEIYDIAPTMLGLMDAEAPTHLTGRDWSR